jgi:hypothetical protein
MLGSGGAARARVSVVGMKTIAVALFALLAVAVAGCGHSDPLTRIEAQYDSTVNAICDACPMASGTLTAAECRAMAETQNPFMGTQWDCQRNAYAMYPNELGPYYDCVAGAISRYDGCMRSAFATCPPADTAVTACGDALQADIRACPVPDSMAATTALSHCFGP